MTTNEAKYVVRHRDMYTDETFHYALRVLEAAGMDPFNDFL